MAWILVAYNLTNDKLALILEMDEDVNVKQANISKYIY